MLVIVAEQLFLTIVILEQMSEDVVNNHTDAKPKLNFGATGAEGGYDNSFNRMRIALHCVNDCLRAVGTKGAWGGAVGYADCDNNMGGFGGDEGVIDVLCVQGIALLNGGAVVGDLRREGLGVSDKGVHLRVLGMIVGGCYELLACASTCADDED